VGDNLSGLPDTDPSVAVTFNPNDVIPDAFETGNTIRPNNMQPARLGIFRYMLSGRNPIRQARINGCGLSFTGPVCGPPGYGFLPADPITGRPNVVDIRLSEDGAGPGTCLNGIDESADGADGADGTVTGVANDCINPATGLVDLTRAEDGQGPGTCGNGIDDGADGPDSLDGTLDCWINPEQTEGGVVGGCTNGVDDDMPGNGLIDGFDPQCQYPGGGQAAFDFAIDRRHDANTLMHELGHMLALGHGGPAMGPERDEDDPDCINIVSDLYDPTLREDGIGLWSCSNTVDDGAGDGADINDTDCFLNGTYMPNFPEDGLGLNTCGNRGDDAYGVNCKPNYLSIMNYLHSGIGIPQTMGSRREDGSTNPLSCSNGVDDGEGDGADGNDADSDCVWGADLDGDGFDDGMVLDYSPPRFTDGRGQAPLATLTETALIELNSVLDATDPFNRFIFNSADGADAADPDCNPGGVYSPIALEDSFGSCQDGVDNQYGLQRQWPANNDNDGNGVAELLGIDWTNEGAYSFINRSADIDGLVFSCPENRGISGNALLGAHDWANLVYSIADILANAAGPFPERPMSEVFVSEILAREQAYRTDLALSTTSACTALPMSLDFTVENLGPSPVSGVMVELELPAGVAPGDLPEACLELEAGVLGCVASLLDVDESKTFTVELEGQLAADGNGEIHLRTFHVNGPDIDLDNNEVVVVVVDPEIAVSVCHSDPQFVDLGVGSCEGELTMVGSRAITPTIPLIDGNLEVIPGRTYTVTYGGSNPFEQRVVVQEIEGTACCEAGQTVLEGNQQGNQLTPTQDGDYCVLGHAGQDFIVTPDGNDLLFGNNDGDSITSDGGDDRMIGGKGQDQLTCGTSGVFEAHGGLDGDHLAAVYCASAKLWGGTSADHLTGSPGADELFPGSGADFVYGGQGDDLVTLFDACEASSGKTLDGGQAMTRS